MKVQFEVYTSEDLPAEEAVSWELKPLDELAGWMVEFEDRRQKEIAGILERNPLFFEEMAAKIAATKPQREAREAELKAASEKADRERIEQDKKDNQKWWDKSAYYEWKRTKLHGPPPPGVPPPPPPEPRQPEFVGEHSIEWWPFVGYGRYSPDGQWHIAWGSGGGGQSERRVGVSFQGELKLWFEPRLHIGQAWVADNGSFCIKVFAGADDVVFGVGVIDGRCVHIWRRHSNWLRFLRFDPDGLGYGYEDENGVFDFRIDG